MQRELTAHLETIVDEPDEGIWEVRGPRQHFTHSKVMAWVALDRAIKAAEHYRLESPIDRWRTLRRRIHAAVCAEGFDSKRGSFVQAYGSRHLELLIPLVGFLPASDPRVRGTLDAIGKELMVDGLVLRYHTADTDDGLPPGEGAFLACSFWYVDNLALAGRHGEARDMFEHLLTLRNDVGLLAEEYDPRARRQLGNFPQAFSHLALIDSAYNLSRRKNVRPAEQRSVHDRRRGPGGNSVHRQEQPAALVVGLSATDGCAFALRNGSCIAPCLVPGPLTKHAIARVAAVLLCATACAACDGPQSSLEPAGVEAQGLADLFFALTAAAAVIWCATVGLALYAAYGRREPSGPAFGARLIVGGGVVVPTVVLAATLSYGLHLLPPLLADPSDGELEIEVVGEQWWWRVRYLSRDGAPVDLANEIRLPAGAAVLLTLSSDNVIHSFWIPALGGKVDMIPGRRTQLVLHPTVAGVYRGVCAEYCGTSHALMAFRTVVHERQDFDDWLAHQASSAAAPVDELAENGGEAFVRNGCGACHTVRGTPASGIVGPDLTHVGSRLSLGAGTLPNDPEAFFSWVSQTDGIKPGVHMPAFGMLPTSEIRALAAYLEALQ